MNQCSRHRTEVRPFECDLAAGYRASKRSSCTLPRLLLLSVSSLQPLTITGSVTSGRVRGLAECEVWPSARSGRVKPLNSGDMES